MTKRMLIDATQQEETRVVLTSGNRVEDFDFETANRRQLKGNIYLARVTRVEPSLQAAFVEYGGNRHGFLAFSEIHPDYYRIPMEDREALLAEQLAHADNDLDDDPDDTSDDDNPDADDARDSDDGEEDRSEANDEQSEPEERDGGDADSTTEPGTDETQDRDNASNGTNDAASTDDDKKEQQANVEAGPRRRSRTERPSGRPSHRRYRIQEVVTRRQIILIQVVKEERGNKGAALTTFLSLAGRYCVLMPNTPRGGGVSRKITNAVDRKRLKQVVAGLEVPEDMAVIVRTAGSQRTKTEIKRDYEYLLRLWDQIRELTLESSAPCLVHEEANLIKRSIRDLYTRDIDEVLVEGEEGYRIAKSFMKMLVPSHARRVQPFSNGGVPLFHHFQVESQLDGIHSSTVQLRSGGYIVLNQTEALVAIDVNSGRSTRERNIEETALKTNLEAAEEVARQLRLRDLAGLIVIDYIDMDESRNQHAVERKMKDVVKDDRARIQLGRISQFGLMELSRQRLRPSVTEASTQPCPHCEGTGRVRSIDSAALQVLRNIEDEGLKQRASEIIVHVPSAIGFYILNNKRDVLVLTEKRYAFRVTLQPDDALIAPEHRIERLGAKTASERNAVLNAIGANAAAVIEDVEEDEIETTEIEEEDTERERRPRRRRRRNDRGRAEETEIAQTSLSDDETSQEVGDSDQSDQNTDDDDSNEDDDGNKRRRRRGKRGGRRRVRRVPDEDGVEITTDSATTAGENGASPDTAVNVSGSTDDVADTLDATEEAKPTASSEDEPAEENKPETTAEQAQEPEAPRKRTPRARRPRRRPEPVEQSTEPALAQPKETSNGETPARVEQAATVSPEHVIDEGLVTAVAVEAESSNAPAPALEITAAEASSINKVSDRLLDEIK
ncbi:MAG: ribonuclease E/G, partial [Alphaproteobacteria bacterium]|nr:ribonuclease E/G [Alphaproteobacteria bacterium]